MLEKVLPENTVDEPACAPADQLVAAVTAPPARPSDLEALLCHLLPTALVPTPPPQPKPTTTVRSGDPDADTAAQTGMAGVEALLQRLLPGTPGQRSICRTIVVYVVYSST